MGADVRWLALALLIIVIGGFAILRRLKLLWIAVCFWLSFATGIALLAAAGHEMTARWHLGPISGFEFWWVLVTSPEILVFLFFMITDPKTAPRAPRSRIAYAIAIGVLASLLIAPVRTEWATKVALLSALFLVCAASPIVAALPLRRLVAGRARLAVASAAVVAYAAVLLVAGGSSHTDTAAAAATGRHVDVTILPSKGVQTQLDESTAQLIAQDLASEVPAAARTRVSLWLEPGGGQDPPLAVARLAGRTYRLKQVGTRGWTLASGSPAPSVVALPRVPVLHGYALADVAKQVGASFTQSSFRFGVSSDPTAMMGGGVCWLDYDNDGWLDLFVVNSYTDAQYAQWQEHGGAPAGALFHNVHGRFVNVTRVSGTGLPLRGNGCVAGDFDGDGRTDLFVTTATDDVLFWNNGDGTFTEGARKAGIVSFGWHTGAAMADVNGDGRPDLFVAGYTNMAEAIPTSLKGFPSNYAGVRDELFLNEGHRRFKDVGPQVGLDPKPFDHSLGAEFVDVNGDGRPDLYVANDEDRNKLYLNEPGGPLGFHFVEAGRSYGVADTNAGMGIAAGDTNGDGRPDLYVTNSRGQGNAAYRSAGSRFDDVRKLFDVGVNPTGWGDTWVDLRNTGARQLVVANGAIPVTNVARDAAPLQVLAPQGSRYVDSGLLRSLKVNGRGLAAGDFDNDGRVDLAVGDGRRPAPSAAQHLDLRQLARGAREAVLAGRCRHGRRQHGPSAGAGRPRRQQLSLLGGPAGPLRLRQGKRPLADGALPGRHGEDARAAVHERDRHGRALSRGANPEPRRDPEPRREPRGLTPA